MQLALHKSWYDQLKDEIAKPYVKELKMFLAYEKEAGSIIYPPQELVFNAFSKTPFEKVKVVIVGQDPYHGPNQAHGLSFSVQEGIKPPPSLKNIYTELHNDIGFTPPNHGCLEKWADQGVLLLNATLTVRARLPRSHYGKGWEQFTDAVIEKLRDRKDPLVFLLWGKSAQEKCERVLTRISHKTSSKGDEADCTDLPRGGEKCGLNAKEHPHAVFTAAHPSPYSATHFFGCRHFSKANECLKKWGKTPIDWSL